MWSKWSRSKWSFSFSDCVIYSLYINIKYLYIVEDIDNSKSFWPNDQMTIMTAGCCFIQVPCSSLANPYQIPTKSHFPPILRNGLVTDLKRTCNGGRAKEERTPSKKRSNSCFVRSGKMGSKSVVIPLSIRCESVPYIGATKGAKPVVYWF